MYDHQNSKHQTPKKIQRQRWRTKYEVLTRQKEWSEEKKKKEANNARLNMKETQISIGK